jgi:hypothetical protein
LNFGARLQYRRFRIADACESVDAVQIGCALDVCAGAAAVPETVTFTELFRLVLFGPVTFNV